MSFTVITFHRYIFEMYSILEYIDSKIIAAGLGAVYLLFSLRNTLIIRYKKPTDVPARSDNPDSELKVFLFLSPGERRVSGSPASVKLSTYLRLAGIPHSIHEAKHDEAPKSKVPYIKQGTHFFGDSQLIIRYVENTYDVSSSALTAAKEYSLKKRFVPFALLNKEQQAQSDMIRLLCESDLYWVSVSMRWAGELGVAKSEGAWHITAQKYFAAVPSLIRWIIVPMIRVNILRDAWGQGYFRHSPNDQLYLARRGVAALSAQLGSKEYFLGDFPSECDCAVFGALNSGLIPDSIWPINEIQRFIIDECPNLVDYERRLRQMVFPDMKAGEMLPPSVTSFTKAPVKNN